MLTLFVYTLYCDYGPCYVGGAIAGTSDSEISVYENSTCSNNTCQGNGGCVHSLNTINFENSVMSGNAATFGGGIYTDFGAVVGLIDAIITDNKALQSGGAWFANGADQFERSDSTSIITNNVAGCCYASGYGSSLQNNSTSSNMTCADLDTGTY
jgi:hypothetical protein